MSGKCLVVENNFKRGSIIFSINFETIQGDLNPNMTHLHNVICGPVANYYYSKRNRPTQCPTRFTRNE